MTQYNSLVFELSTPGRIAYSLPALDVEAKEVSAYLPETLIRTEEAALPEISELQLMRRRKTLESKQGFIHLVRVR